MNVIIDLETLSTRSNACIVVIAAIKFSNDNEYPETMLQKDLNKMDIFYRRIKFDTNSKYHTDINTINWWHQQPEEIYYESFEHPDRVLLKEALIDFTKWIGTSKDQIKIWGNGSSFDVTILGEAFEIEGLKPCWAYWNVRDLRTLLDIGGIKMNELPSFSKHHALWDCYREIIGYQRAMKNIRNTTNITTKSKKRKIA